MQVTAGLLREHEKPMSWARAMLIAIGFFFVAAIFLGMIPSYVFTVSTSATVATFEQTFLTLGLLSLGMGLMSLEISFLYDPRPLIPWPLFALVGAGLAAIGAAVLLMVYIGPFSTIPGTNMSGWPQIFPDNGYLIAPIWFQASSIDLGGVGTVALLTGVGMFAVAALNPWVLSGRAFGPTRDLAVRFCIGLAVVLITLYLALLTFVPAALHPTGIDPNTHALKIVGSAYAWGNVMLFLGLLTALLGVAVWLLPVMTANRQQFMPAVYFHGVINLIGQVAIPLLLAWVVVYPLLYVIHQVDSGQFWVQCSQKTKIPASCSFTQFSGYIICAIVFQALFTMLILGVYFWSTRRNTVVLGGTVALLWLGLAAMVLHTGYSPLTQPPTGIMIAIVVIVLAFIFTWATQREFAPTRVAPLGCTGQWLVLGTLLLVFLFGFAFFSIPQFFELESGLALFFQPGAGGLHDALWGALLMGLLALLQFGILMRRGHPMSDLRKFALWTLLLGVTLMIIASIQGFKNDVIAALGSGGIDGLLNAIEGSHVVYFFGLLFAIVGLGASLWGAWLTRPMPWLWIVLAPAVVLGIGFTVVIYSLSYAGIVLPDLTTFGMIAGLTGALAYAAIGPDSPDEAFALTASQETFVVAPR